MPTAPRDLVYFKEWTAKKSRIPYRLEYTPPSADEDDVVQPLPTTIEYAEFPADIFLAECTLNNGFEKLPYGIAQKSDLELSLRLKKNNTAHQTLMGLIASPLVVKSESSDIIYAGHTCTRVTRGQMFLEYELDEYNWDHGTNIITTNRHVVLSTTPSVTIDEYDITGDPQPWTYRQLSVADDSPDAAFNVTIYRTNAYWDDTLMSWVSGSEYLYSSQSFIVGSPTGYESDAMPVTAKFGGLWRIWRLDGAGDKVELKFEGMQRRTPPTETTENTKHFDTRIKAGDTARCSLEGVTIPLIAAAMPAPVRSMSEVASLRSQSESILYKHRAGFESEYHKISDLYDAISDCAAEILTSIRRKDALVTINPPRTVQFYKFEDSHTELSPAGGIDAADCLFNSFVREGSNVTSGVLAPEATKADEAWEKDYGNAFDLVTDLATNFITKHVISYSDDGIEVHALGLFDQLPLQDSITLAATDFVSDRLITPGGATVRGTTCQISQPGSDDLDEVKYFIANSEREEEFSPRILLHNIPSFEEQLVPQLLFAEGATDEVRALTEGARINAGNAHVFAHQARLYDWLNSVLNRDQIIAAVQREAGLANAIAKAFTRLFSSLSLTTVKGVIITRTNLHSGRCGAIVGCHVPGSTNPMSSALVSSSDDLVEGTSDIELVGVAT